uniref:Protease inhibitor-like protein n=1 Tax=Antheraea mylitta TaxID=34739 RepID=Q0Q008_ANTMY|nr:protease inhibitor-like protein [Antheraea mylitta]
MKFVHAMMLMTLVIITLGTNANAQNCPSGRPGCICTAQYEPVCSTQGCTYGNACQLYCAGGKKAYDGECRKH